MHRSGTSAVTGALGRLGLALPPEDDLMAAGPANPEGFYESDSLVALDDELLRVRGGSWSAPPRHWEEGEAAEMARTWGQQAAATFEKVYGTEVPAVWKDPRACLLLPFWRAVLERPVAAVFVWRDPVAVARSLLRHQELPLALGLALWERYNREALAGMRGMAVCSVRYESVLADPPGWCRRVAAWLSEVAGEPAGGAWDVEGAAGFFSAALRRERSEAPEGLLLDSQLDLVGALGTLEEVQAGFVPPELAPIGPWTEALLEARAAQEALGDPGALARERREASRQREVLAGALGWAAERMAALHGGAPGRQAGGQEWAPGWEAVGAAGLLEPCGLDVDNDFHAYRAWLEERGEPVRTSPPLPGKAGAVRAAAAAAGAGEALFSVAIPVYRPDAHVLDLCVGSVLAQSFGQLEVCLCDDGSGDPELERHLADLAAVDPRCRVGALAANGGIAAATNAAVALGRAEWVAFVDQDDELHSEALEEVARAVAAHPEADVVYTDEDKIDRDGWRRSPHFKPAWSPDYLLSCPYLGHLLVVRRRLLEEVGGLRSAFDGSQDYDLMLRVTERARDIVRVPRVLYHWRAIPGSAALEAQAKPWAHDASRRVVADALARRGEEARVEPTPYPGWYHVRRGVSGRPLVSVIVPFRDHAAQVRTCLDSLRRCAGYDRLEVVAVDNGSVEPETAALVAQLAGEPGVRVVERPAPFNWAALNNDAAEAAAGDVLVFVNDDVEARRDGWLLAMLEHAQRPEVGAVGARLLYPDGSVQHVGVVVGMGGVAAHVFAGLDGRAPGYFGRARVTSNFSAVTGACMATRREVFEELGGFDAAFAISYNDIDYCLRLGRRGYRVLVTPLAELVHHESATRGTAEDLVAVRRLLERWGPLYRTGDPFYSPNLSILHADCRARTPEEGARWEALLGELGLDIERGA